MQELFDEVAVAHTEKAGDAERFASEAVGSVDSVFAMGGDGTVNEAISGIASHEERPRFGFFPLGTVNDLARALAIPLDPEEAIESFSLNHSRKIDIGKINDDYFMNVVAIGIIPAAINNVEVEEKTKLGKWLISFPGYGKYAKMKAINLKLSLVVRKQQKPKLKAAH